MSGSARNQGLSRLPGREQIGKEPNPTIVRKKSRIVSLVINQDNNWIPDDEKWFRKAFQKPFPKCTFHHEQDEVNPDQLAHGGD